MSSFKTLTIASTKMFVRNKQAIFFTFFMPLVFMMVFGLIGRDRVPQTDIGWVIKSTLSNGTLVEHDSFQDLLKTIKDIPTFKVTEGIEIDEQAALDKGDRALVVIPPRLIDSNLNPRVLVNISKQQEAQSAIMIIQQIIDKQTLAQAGISSSIQLHVETVNARNLKYIDFLLPGLVAMAIMQMSVFSVAFVFADYREKGVLKRLTATPLKPLSFVGANIVTRLMVSLVQAIILILIGVLVFNATVVGSYGWVLVLVIFGALMFLCLGFTISSFAKTVETVPAIANLVILPMLFLGGVFFPVTNFPNWLQHIAKLLPITPFSTALRAVMIDGAGFSAISKDFGLLVLWTVALMTFATLTFRFQDKES